MQRQKNLHHKKEVRSCFLGPVDLNTARNSPTANTTQRQGGQDAPVFSAIDTGHTRVLLLEFSISHYTTGCLTRPERNHLRTFKEVIPFKGLPRVLLTQYFISQFSLHFLFHLKLKRLLSRSSFLKTGRFVICTSNVPTTPEVGPELYLSGDSTQ